MEKNWLVNNCIAHRGLHNEIVPENSLGAFKLAVEKNYAIELDVQLLCDGTVIVFHDHNFSRMAGKDKYVSNSDFEDVKTFKLINSDEKIPTFAEVLNVVNGKVPLLIEVKNNGKIGELEKNVLKLLKNYKGEFAIQSFNPYTLKWFKDNAPEILRGQLSSFFKGEKLAFLKKFMLKKLRFAKIASPNFISYNTQNLPNRYVKKFSNLPLLAWTVKTQEEYLRVQKFCDSIIFENFLPKF